MTEKILDSEDWAVDSGFESYRKWVIRTGTLMFRRLILTNPPTEAKLAEIRDDDPPVIARIDYGRWLADCECGGAELVSFKDPFFFCLSCGNFSCGGRARKVEFPRIRAAIESELLRRPVKSNTPNTTRFMQALTSKPMVGELGRHWSPGISLAQLRKENEQLEK